MFELLCLDCMYFCMRAMHCCLYKCCRCKEKEVVKFSGEEVLKMATEKDLHISLEEDDEYIKDDMP